MMIPKAKFLALIVVILFIMTLAHFSLAQDSITPIAKGPGVSQEDFDAYAEAHGRLTLSSAYDLARPARPATQRLKKNLEKAQELWLAGSIDGARGLFKEIVSQALEADWREAEREAIHYAFLRLAQSAMSPVEKDEWIESAARTFPDIKADPELFPPPLLEAYRSVHTRVTKLSVEYDLRDRFRGFRLLLINGKRFDLTQERKIRIPTGSIRLSAFADDRLPISEKLSTSQLEHFQASTPSLFSGSCLSPEGGESFLARQTDINLRDLDVLYSERCVRTRSESGWRSNEKLLADVEAFNEKSTKSQLTAREIQLPFSEPPRAQMTSRQRKWMWVGLSALAAGTAYVLYREMNREAPAPEIRVEPVYRSAQ